MDPFAPTRSSPSLSDREIHDLQVNKRLRRKPAGSRLVD
jgi:hypothetical protein